MSGLPQGSILCPVIFIIYIDCLPDSVTNHIKLFTDNSKLWSKIKTIEVQYPMYIHIRVQWNVHKMGYTISLYYTAPRMDRHLEAKFQ